jgi:AraC family transcriptional regulator
MQSITLGTVVRCVAVGDFRLTLTAHAPDLHLPAHDHELANVNFVLAGGYIERVGRADLPLNRGDAVLKPPGAAHSNRYGTSVTRCLAVEIGRDCLTRERLRQPRVIPAAAASPIGDALCAEFRLGAEASPLVVEGLLLQALGHAERESRRETSPRLPQWLVAARGRLTERWRHKESLVDIAADLDVTPAHLSRTFARYYGLTITAYFRRLRVEAARRLLIESRETLARIALDAGFADQSHFSREFRRAVGQTPREYRRAQRDPKRSTP